VCKQTSEGAAGSAQGGGGAHKRVAGEDQGCERVETSGLTEGVLRPGRNEVERKGIGSGALGRDSVGKRAAELHSQRYQTVKRSVCMSHNIEVSTRNSFAFFRDAGSFLSMNYFGSNDIQRNAT